MDDTETIPEPEPAPPRRWRLPLASGATIGLPILVFALGIVTGLPLALFGLDFVMENAAAAFSVMLVTLLLLALFGVLIIAFRRQIWQRLFRVGEVELGRIGEPLGQVVRLTSERRISEATVAASDLARLVMARYAWIATRRWIIGAVTGFIAVIAALAGSALLFQQNQLLRVQGDLMRQQTERLTEQTRMLETQIQLGEAQRSTSIVPDILGIGAAIGTEMQRQTSATATAGSDALSAALRARIVAATLAARPYRYLVYGLDSLTDDEVVAEALSRRADLTQTQADVRNAIEERDAAWGVSSIDPRPAAGELTDRIVSPERGQILGMLYNGRLRDLTRLSYEGADFSFAELRNPVLDGIDLRFGKFAFADFSRLSLADAQFGAARLDQARFIGARLYGTSFASIPNADVPAPFTGHAMLPYQPTRMVGTDFSGSDMEGVSFATAQALSANFDNAAVFNADFSGTLLLAATFRNAILYNARFAGADLTKTDFDGAVVFEPDFLERVKAEAVPNSFDAGAYRLEQLDDSIMVLHPGLVALARLPVDIQNNQPPLRLVRLRPVESNPESTP